MGPKKAKLARAGTMRTTAKDAVAYLYPSEKGGKKKPYYSYLKGKDVDNLKAMGVDVPDLSSGSAQGAKGSKGKKGGKPTMKRDSTMAKTVAEANQLLEGKVTFADEGKGKRTRGSAKKATPAKKPALKRAGTMQNTAKEGKSFLKCDKGKGKGKKGKGKK